jgi:hypothetical protein
MALWRKKTERDRLLEVRPNFRVVFSRSQVAAALWDYAEDDLAATAIGMTDEALAGIRRIGAWLEDPAYPLPLEEQKATHNHVTAFAAIVFYEGTLRPLRQSRRRPAKLRPDAYTPVPPGPGES